MDTVLVILVLLIVIALLGSIGYFFVREAGPENAQQWLTAPRQLRDSVTALVTRPPGSRIDGSEPGVKLEPGAVRQGGNRNRLEAPPEATLAMAIDDSALRELKEELHDELRRATGLTREFDARLNRMESVVAEAPRQQEEFNRALREQDERRQREVDRLERELGTMRLTLGSYGERRGEALADFYGHLARVEVALAAVVNPMLLPGESLTLPPEMLPETMVWANWNDVGERAFAFGNAFNQNRFVLEPETADQIERFIVTLRQVLTRDVYPAVRNGSASPAQIAQMRTGLQTIVRDLPAIRRRLEDAYRLTSDSASTAAPSPDTASSANGSADERAGDETTPLRMRNTSRD